MQSSLVFSLCFVGMVSMVTVWQPPVLPAARGQDVVLPCSLRLSSEDELTEPLVLYWLFNLQNQVQVWVPSETYRGRVSRLEDSPYTLNNSIWLRKVRWSDGGPYLCKLTITTERRRSFRCSGNRTTLMVHDRLVLVRGGPADSQLRCEVNVSRDTNFSLAVLHRGAPLQPVAPGPDPVEEPCFVTLSQTVSLQGPGRYECHLLLLGDLVTKSIFHLNQTERGASVENQTSADSPLVLNVEPWHLYGALLAVPAAALLLLLASSFSRQ